MTTIHWSELNANKAYDDFYFCTLCVRLFRNGKIVMRIQSYLHKGHSFFASNAAMPVHHDGKVKLVGHLSLCC